MNKLEKRILYYSSPMQYIFRKADHIFLPGFEGFSLYQVGRFFAMELRSHNFNMRVAAVTYNLLMAIPPTMLFLFSLVPYLPLKDVQETILNTLRLITPNQRIYENIQSVVVDFMNKPRRDVLSFGVLLTLFFSSNGMMGLMLVVSTAALRFIKKDRD